MRYCLLMDFTLRELILAGLSLVPVMGLVVLAQILWSRKILKGEYSRKFIHMISAAWIASWRFFLPVGLVVNMAIIMGVGVVLFKRLRIFRSIYSVKRATYGEATFAIGVLTTALLFRDPAVYFLCIINLGFADGLAAIIGRKFGRGKKKKILGDKSYIGTAACFLFALLSGALFWNLVELGADVNQSFGVIYVTLAAFLIAMAELFADKGIDNIIIPLVTGIIFSGIIA